MAAARASSAERLLRWARDNPKAPAHWLVLAKRLGNPKNSDMATAWRRLENQGDVAFAVFQIVRQAYEQAHAETARPTCIEETKALQTVRALALELKKAIAEAPLPRNSSGLYELDDCDASSTYVAMGWRELTGEHFGLPRMTVTDALDWAVAAVDQHIAALPPRSVLRQGAGSEPMVRAFVRHLPWHIKRAGISASNEVLGYIASAALDLANPLDKDDVKAILKDAPRPFRVLNGPKKTS